MRVVFMGTPEFAVPSLRALAREHEVVAAYTRPDAASGRGSQLRPSPVKLAAGALGIPVRQPASLRDDSSAEQLRALQPDVLVVAAYGVILPIAILEVPPFGALNVHASLLPRWRGAAPIQRAILAGDARTGVSIMRMEAGLDTGPYCEVVETEIADKSSDALTRELAEMGAEALSRSLARLSEGTDVWVEQDESLVTYASKVLKSDVGLHPGLSVIEFVRRVRAAGKQAPARLAVGGRGLTVLEARASEHAPAAGSVSLLGRAVVFGACDGGVDVLSLRPDGKGAMDASAWARGAALDANAQWSALA